MVLALGSGATFAQKAYDPGASDTEVKLGQTMPYSGPVSGGSGAGKSSMAYFEALNKAGGINGRKITLISSDDNYSPPKTVEATRKLVESDEVLFMYGSVGTPTNASVQKYLNAKKVPQLFIGTGASRFKDPKTAPWTTSALPGYSAEGKALARFVLKSVAEPKIAIVYQNDDLGKDYVAGFKIGLGDKVTSLIVSEKSFEVTDPTLTSQVVSSKASGANVLFYAGTQKYAAMAIRTRFELGWTPMHLMSSTSANMETVMKPAGFDAAEGVFSTAYTKDPTDPAWADDPEVKSYLQWFKANMGQKDPHDFGFVLGYIASYLAEHVLREAGDNLTRQNILKLATNLDHVRAPLLLPGITFHITPADYGMITLFKVQRFHKGAWVGVGDIVSSE
jgi:ABC-type branched-subunit amino acid transport system substrate-binding protein